TATLMPPLNPGNGENADRRVPLSEYTCTSDETPGPDPRTYSLSTKPKRFVIWSGNRSPAAMLNPVVGTTALPTPIDPPSVPPGPEGRNVGVVRSSRDSTLRRALWRPVESDDRDISFSGRPGRTGARNVIGRCALPTPSGYSRMPARVWAG